MQVIRDGIISAVTQISQALQLEFGARSDVQKIKWESDFMFFVFPIRHNRRLIGGAMVGHTYNVSAFVMVNHSADKKIDTDNTYRNELIEEADRIAGDFFYYIQETFSNITSFVTTETHNFRISTYAISGVLIEFSIDLPNTGFCPTPQS